MEEWHQKLHNNTTPDDVPICKAYIAFLEVGVWAAGKRGGMARGVGCVRGVCGGGRVANHGQRMTGTSAGLPLGHMQLPAPSTCCTAACIHHACQWPDSLLALLAWAGVMATSISTGRVFSWGHCQQQVACLHVSLHLVSCPLHA
jgi:hypothetical protein